MRYRLKGLSPEDRITWRKWQIVWCCIYCIVFAAAFGISKLLSSDPAGRSIAENAQVVNLTNR